MGSEGSDQVRQKVDRPGEDRGDQAGGTERGPGRWIREEIGQAGTEKGQARWGQSIPGR